MNKGEINMLKVNEYGAKIVEDFIEHCKDNSKYDIAMDYGLEVLNDCVRGVKDYAAWCIMNYDTMAIETVKEWIDPAPTAICWSSNWEDPDNSFTITFDALLTELSKCFKEYRDDMSIVITFTGEEIAQLEQVFGDCIEDKEDLYQTIREIVDMTIKSRKVGN